jgi:uncharacterized caspase-like protein
MDKIDATLREWLVSAPQQRVALIVRTAGDPTAYVPKAEELGFSVKHQFRLLPGMAVVGLAGRAAELLDEEWVVSVEEDRQVTASSDEVER